MKRFGETALQVVRYIEIGLPGHHYQYQCYLRTETSLRNWTSQFYKWLYECTVQGQVMQCDRSWSKSVAYKFQLFSNRTPVNHHHLISDTASSCERSPITIQCTTIYDAHKFNFLSDPGQTAQVSTPGPLGAASVPDCCTPARQCVRGLVSAMQSLELLYVRSRSSFAEAFHGWTTGTLVWRQRCDFDLNLWRTGGIAKDKLNE